MSSCGLVSFVCGGLPIRLSLRETHCGIGLWLSAAPWWLVTKKTHYKNCGAPHLFSFFLLEE